MDTIINAFDIKRFVDNDTYKKGISLFNVNKIEFEMEHKDELDYYIVKSSIELKNKCEMSVIIKYNDKHKLYEIKDSNCSCILGSRCEHVTLLLLSLSQYNKNEMALLLDENKAIEKGNTTKDMLMIEQDILNKYVNNEKENHKYRFEPIIYFDNNKIFLKFKIGNNNCHLYIIQNLYEFYDRFQATEVYEYSKKFSCIHNMKYLEEEVSGVNEFLFSKIKNNKNFIESIDYSTIKSKSNLSTDKSYVEITQNDLSILLNYYENKTIKVHINSEKNLVCKNDKLPLLMSIKNNSKKYTISLINDTEFIYFSENYIITIKESNFIKTNVIDKADIDVIKLLLESDVDVCESEFDRVYDNVIKDRLKLIELDTKCGFDEKKISTVKLHTFVDVTKEGYLTVDKKLYKNGKELEEVNYLNLKRKNILAIDDYLKKYKFKNKYIIKNSDDIFNFYNKILNEIINISDETFLSEEFKKNKIIRKPKIKVGVRLESDLLKLDIDIDEQKIENINSILNTYKEKKKYHRLANGDFLLLDSEEFKSLEEIINDVKAKKSKVSGSTITIDKSNSLYIDNLLENSEIYAVSKNKEFAEFIDNFKNMNNINVLIPVLNNTQLRDYQIEGFKFLSIMQNNGFGVILADDMGLGKTIQMISVMTTIKGPHIVVCPSSLVYNWEVEINKFASHFRVGIVKNDKKTRLRVIKNIKDYDIIITSYDTLKRDIDLYEDIEFSMIIIDEAQYIKNPNTKGAQVVKKLKGKHHFALTGTPIENNLTELWSIFDFIQKGYLSTYYSFLKNYEIPIIKEHNSKKLKELQTLVKPFIMRRMKQDVLKELPEKMESLVVCEFEEEQRNIYDAYMSQIREDIENKTDVEYNSNKIQVLSMLMKLRQICCDPQLVLDEKNIPSSKLSLAMELITESIENNRNILLFSQFTSMLSIISHKLEELNIKHHMLTGSLSSKQRMKMVDEFNSDDSRVFLISLKAGGTGLNLTKADVVIHYDPWWNSSSENQATDRAYRIGQKNKVNVYKLIAKDTIEEKIVKIQEKKKSLSDSIVNNSDSPLQSLQKEELLEILQK